MEPEINPFGTKETPLKKRVLFVVTQSEFGGAQRFLYELISRLTDDYDVSAATGITGDQAFTAALKELGVPVYLLHHLERDADPVADILAIRELRSLIKKTAPETVFLNSSKAGFIGARAALPFPKIKVIYRIGGWSFNDPRPGWQKKLWLTLERMSAKWKDYIIVNSQRDLDQALELGIRPREKMILVHNGLDPYRIDFLPREEARAQLSDRTGENLKNKKIIGTIANFYPAKGLNNFIEAAKQTELADTVFCVIGDGSGRAKLEESIKNLGLNKKVFLIGRVDQAARYLPAFDVFVLPSLKEGFPWSVLEAMAAKLPVIATRVGAVSEVIEDGRNGLVVEPGRPELIAEKIKDLFANELKMKEMGIQANQTVILKFSPEKMVEEIKKIL